MNSNTFFGWNISSEESNKVDAKGVERWNKFANGLEENMDSDTLETHETIGIVIDSKFCDRWFNNQTKKDTIPFEKQNNIKDSEIYYYRHQPYLSHLNFGSQRYWSPPPLYTFLVKMENGEEIPWMEASKQLIKNEDEDALIKVLDACSADIDIKTTFHLLSFISKPQEVVNLLTRYANQEVAKEILQKELQKLVQVYEKKMPVCNL